MIINLKSLTISSRVKFPHLRNVSVGSILLLTRVGLGHLQPELHQIVVRRRDVDRPEFFTLMAVQVEVKVFEFGGLESVAAEAFLESENLSFGELLGGRNRHSSFRNGFGRLDVII